MKLIEKIVLRLKRIYYKDDMNISLEKISDRTFELVNKVSKFFGYDIYSDDIRSLINLRFVPMIILLFFVTIDYFYSFYIVRNNYKDFMVLAITFNFLIQVLEK
jgi:hypothetical protein